jgi:hypothetical protein
MDAATCAPDALQGFLSSWLADKIIAPAIVAIVFGASATYFLELYRGRREGATKLADALREDLKRAQDLASEYWSSDRNDKDIILEEKVIAIQSEITKGISLLNNSIREPVTNDISHATAGLLDALTGGQFQTIDRKADPSRIRACAQLTSDLRYKIARARLRSLFKFFGS